MAGIALLLPTEQLVELAREKVAEEGLDVKEIRCIATANAVNEARRSVADGASVIIARGYQASEIKKYTNVPIVEIALTGQDLGILVKKARTMVEGDCPRIALIGFQNMFSNIDNFDELFHVQMRKYYVSAAEDLQLAADQAVADQVDIMIGGNVAVMVAKQAGIPHLFLESTFDSIREAIKSAETAIYAAEVEKRHNAQIGAFLDNPFSGIIRINTLGVIMSVNRVASELLHQSEAKLLGQQLTSVVPDMNEDEARKVLNGKREFYSSFIRVKGAVMIYILTAIVVDGIIDGGLLSCQAVKQGEEKESETLKEMYLKGFVARTEFQDIRSKDKKMIECMELAKLYSLSNNPVLIKGGVGEEKRKIAECIHNNSLRKNAPFVVVSCSDMTVEQQEKLLFGIAASEENRTESIGTIARANHGTLLIEEIECMSRYVQYRLFNMIHHYVMAQSDSESTATADTRFIMTTNVDLKKRMQQGEFREDLYYTITGLSLEIPELANRPSDLEEFIDRTMKAKMKQYGRYHVLTSGARSELLHYRWKGNELQIERFMERLVLSARKRNIDEEYVRQLLTELYPVVSQVNGEERVVIYKDPKADELASVLEKHHGDRSAAAAELGISKTTLWRHMKKYGITGKYNIS